MTLCTPSTLAASFAASSRGAGPFTVPERVTVPSFAATAIVCPWSAASEPIFCWTLVTSWVLEGLLPHPENTSVTAISVSSRNGGENFEIRCIVTPGFKVMEFGAAVKNYIQAIFSTMNGKSYNCVQISREADAVAKIVTSGNRRTAVVLLGSLALLVLLVLVAENAFDLKFLSPTNTGSILFLTAFSGLSFLLFLILVVLLLRNILKLYAGEQSRVLGSRLRTRMLLGALLLSVAPAFFMLFFNYLLMNRSIDRWFSQPVVQLRNESMQIAMEMSHYAAANARAEAESLANTSELAAADTPSGQQAILDLFHQHKVTLQGGFVVVYRDGKAIDQYQMPESEAPMSSGLRSRSFRPRLNRSSGDR